MPLITVKTGSRIELKSGSLMTAGPVPPVVSDYDTLILASSPLAYHKMDETSGLVMIDSSGNANDGDYVTPIALSSTGVVNDGGTSVAYNGVSGQSISNLASGMLDLATSTSPKTLEGWFNTTDNLGPIVVGRNPTSPILGIYLGNNGVTNDAGRILCIMRGDNGAGLQQLNSPLTYNDGSDHHFAMTIETDKTWTLYIDGASVISATHALSSGITITNAQLANDAVSDGGSPHEAFAGRLDNIAIYNSSLSAGTVLAHYNAGL